MILAGLAALVGFAACLVVGFAAALALPERTTIGVYGAGSDFVSETLRLAVGTTMARLKVTGLGTGTIMPLTFLLAPVGGTAAAAYSQSTRTSAQPPRMRLVWGAAAAIPFALLMMTIALVAGGSFFGYEADFAMGSVLFYSLLWGAVGGLLGTWLAIRRNAPETAPGLVPPQAARPLHALTSTLKPLVVLLAVSSVMGLLAWEVQTLKGEQTAKAGRSTVAAPVENLLFVPNLGVTTAALGMFSEFRRSQFQQTTAGPLPVSDDQVDDLARNLSGSERPTGRILAYRDAVPVYVFIPGLLLLTLIPLTLALYGGFSTARRMSAQSVGVAVARGALVGIVWALAFVIVRAVADEDSLAGESLFASVLLLGTAAGALGGFLAHPRTEPSSQVAATAPEGDRA